eukprot:1081444-Alexandrium_andersonii.AAC.1
MRAGASKSVIVMSWNCLAGSTAQKKKRFLFCVLAQDRCCDCGCEGFHTIQDVMAMFAWSMGLLREQPAPNEDHQGQRLRRDDLSLIHI